MANQTCLIVAAASTFTLGVALTAIGWTDYSAREPEMLVGLTLVIIGVMAFIGLALLRIVRGRIIALDDMFADGVEIGYRRGWREGRRTGRPVVVRARCPHCGEALHHEAS
jgi:hypothetical protein